MLVSSQLLPQREKNALAEAPLHYIINKPTEQSSTLQNVNTLLANAHGPVPLQESEDNKRKDIAEEACQLYLRCPIMSQQWPSASPKQCSENHTAHRLARIP